jgi:tetraacyldisaccharide 4'-kinase
MPLSHLYAAMMTWRNRRYDEPGAALSAGVPVISVGNLTVGGTGKTPLVMEIVRKLVAAGRRPAILTRGYHARRGETADEVQEYAAELPDVPVVVDADRVAGAATAQAVHAADCCVLDDGFQHRRLARDLDVVLIDALRPWGGGRGAAGGAPPRAGCRFGTGRGCGHHALQSGPTRHNRRDCRPCTGTGPARGACAGGDRRARGV